MISLRRSALRWLAASLVAIGAAAAASSYILVLIEANALLDNQLRQIAFYIADAPRDLVRPPPRDPAYEHEEDFLVQAWDAAGHALGSSNPSFPIARQAATGFTDQRTDDKTWRTFAYVGAERTVQVSQRTAVRQELATDAALRTSIPILLAIPLVWLLLGFVIDRVLRPLERVTAEVASRDAASLTPVATEGVPREVAALVGAMNGLLERLQAAMAQQRRFVSDAAHELRTPLAALMLQIGNARAVARGPVIRERLADVEAGARRAANLVGQLLALARHDIDRPLQASDVSLTDIAAACAIEIAPLARRNGVEVVIERRDGLRLQGEPAELKVLVGNLLDNAVRYMPDGGTIRLIAEQRPGGAVLEIVDTGPGIPQELLGRVFERFFRAASQDIEGTGLGLSIARSIADRHGLGLALRNRDDRSGLVATLTLPQHEAAGAS